MKPGLKEWITGYSTPGEYEFFLDLKAFHNVYIADGFSLKIMFTFSIIPPKNLITMRPCSAGTNDMHFHLNLFLLCVVFCIGQRLPDAHPL